MEARQLNKVLNVVIVLSVVLIGLFAYSAWVDRPARVKQFAEVEIPDNVPDMSMTGEKKPESMNIVVRILNGNGVSGVAYKLREYLLSEGFDVSETTNADHFNYEKTIVYLHTNDDRISKAISEKLGIPDNPVLDDRAPDYPCDVTIVMGKDYKQLKPFLENN